MKAENKTGLFGKLPAHGDFIYRDLPSQFMTVWDEWLQGYIGSSREQLGESWLDTYMTSPIWRFAFSEGVVDENAWAGIFLPSVDRVGRYFPFSIASRLPTNTVPAEFLCSRSNWYHAMEDAALRALNGHLQIDDLVEELNDSNPRVTNFYTGTDTHVDLSSTVIRLPSREHPPNSALPFVVDAFVKSQFASYSIWSTTGSDHVDASLFYVGGLPKLAGIAAMLDGHWDHWGWSEPFLMTRV